MDYYDLDTKRRTLADTDEYKPGKPVRKLQGLAHEHDSNYDYSVPKKICRRGFLL